MSFLFDVFGTFLRILGFEMSLILLIRIHITVKKNCDLNSETALTFYRKLSSEVRKKRQHWKQEVKNRIIGSGSAFYLEAAMLKHDIPTDPVIRTMTFKYRRKQARCSGS